MESSRGNFPLVYPVITFSAMMTITLLVIAARNDKGTPLVETWMRVDKLTRTRKAVGQIVTWIVVMNLCCMIFIVPTVLIRLLFLPDNTLVP